VRISESADAADETGAAMGGPERFEEFFEATYEPVLRALYLVAGNRHELLDPLVHLRSLRLLQGLHLDVAGPFGGS
jgi:hypothetical protein